MEHELKYDITVHVDISIPIIGDGSITYIAPPSGFSFSSIPLDDYKYKSKIIDRDGAVQFDFTCAVHGESQNRIINLLECNEIIIVKQSFCISMLRVCSYFVKFLMSLMKSCLDYQLHLLRHATTIRAYLHY